MGIAPKLKDLTGKRFGRWQVIEKAPRTENGTYWLCVCDCGTVKAVHSTSLTKGLSKSCGCYAKERTSESHLSNTEVFINKSVALHNNYYDYSLVEYYRSNQKIKIICPVHGVFEVTPNNHLRKKGCPSCSKGGFKKNLPATLYVFVSENSYKIGVTNRPVRERLGKINRNRENKFIVHKTYDLPGDVCYLVEQRLHKLFRIFGGFNATETSGDGFTEIYLGNFTESTQFFVDNTIKEYMNKPVEDIDIMSGIREIEEYKRLHC